MSAEGVVGGAVVTGVANSTGVAMAGLLLTADQSLAMGSIAGCFFFLAASASLPWGSKILYAMGSCIIGYLSGIMLLSMWSNTAGSAIVACLVSALASWVVGSLKRWADGGPRPDWVDWFSGFLPSFIKRGKSDE